MWLLLLIIGFVLLSIYGWLRFQQSLALWDILRQIEMWPGPLYLAISGAVWGLTGLAAGLGLFFRRSWAANWARGSILFLAVWYWFDRQVLAQSEAARSNQIFMALLTAFVIAYTYLVLRHVDRLRNTKQQTREED
jgi:hypothetical protein